MKKRIIFIILLLSLLLDVQRVSAAETPQNSEFIVVSGEVVDIVEDCIYWDDGNDIFYFYADGYSIGDNVKIVMNKGKHVFILRDI